MPLPIAISMGDPAGIGPETIVKALADLQEAGPCVVVGDARLITTTAATLELPVPEIVPTPPMPAKVAAGRSDAACGHAAFLAIRQAASMVCEGRARALVTAPISKAALQAAGHDFPGHTELLAEIAGHVPVRMMLANPELRVVLVTVHLALREAIARLETALILQTLEITDRSLRRFGIEHPRLAVAGLNPHAGEGGLFGDEELRLIAPAVDAARAQGIDVHGPFPPDTIFMRARGLREFDVVVAMYHDQGLIPVKYLGIDDGVNITLGLPFVRTSPDHGTAFDIAGRGIADPRSMAAAIRTAARLSAAQTR